jgi:transposase
VVALANRAIDNTRRRVNQTLLGHRGRKDDPLYKIRRVLLTGAERLSDRAWQRLHEGLRVGDPADEVLDAWLAKEKVRDVYRSDDPDEAAQLLDSAIDFCAASHVGEVRTLGATLVAWRLEILAHHATGASAGPTEAMNLLIEKLRRVGHGFKSFENYRLRLLLYCGVTWPARPAVGLRPRPRRRPAPPVAA